MNRRRLTDAVVRMFRHGSLAQTTPMNPILKFSTPPGLLLLMFAMAIGCNEGRTELPTASVAGTVTYNGKPLEKGRIVFVHQSGQAVGADINGDGTFQLAAFLGQNQVGISCFTPEQMPNSPYSRPGISNGKSL